MNSNFIPGQPLTTVNAAHPGNAIANYFENARTKLNAVDSRTIIEAGTNREIVIEGALTAQQAQHDVNMARLRTEEALKGRFDTARDGILKSIAKPVPQHLRESVAVAKEIGASATEIRALQQAYSDNYAALRYVENELVIKAERTDVPLKSRPVDEVLEELDSVQSQTMRAMDVDPLEAEDNYHALVAQKGEHLERVFSDAETWTSTYGGSEQ